MTETDLHFWEQPENVERFASRAPDKRLEVLLNEYSDPAGTRVVDLGCAGGRNTLLLAERGFDVYAIDASTAMVEHTRQRLTPLFGADGAAGRVWKGRMDDLETLCFCGPHSGRSGVCLRGLVVSHQGMAIWCSDWLVLVIFSLIMAQQAYPSLDPAVVGRRAWQAASGFAPSLPTGIHRLRS